MPAVTRTGDGFAIVGSWGHSETQRFAVFAQRFDRQGGLLGEAMDVILEPEATQVWASVGSEPDGSLRLAWTRQPDTGTDQVYTTRIAASSTIADAPVPVTSGGSSGGVVSADGSLLAYTVRGVSGSTVFIAKIDQLETRLAVGISNRIDHSPYLRGNAMVHYRNIRGFQNSVVYNRFTREPFAITSSEVLVTGPAAPYSPVLAVVPGGYFLGWSEGVNPSFRLLGRFVRE
jgi:DNA segregation ATPase FtsK/SpoIIIE-like protein